MYGSQYVGGTGYAGVVSHAPADVRAEFIRKVYTLFFSSVLITVGVGWFCAQPAVMAVILPMRFLFWLVGFGLAIAIGWSRKANAANVGMLYAFAAVWGAMIGPLLSLVERFAPGVGIQAAVLTVATFGGLSMYAIQSKKDFSYLAGFLFAAVIGLIVAGIVMMFFHTPLMSMIYAAAGILIFCGYTLYDTSQIMNRLAPNEAVAGALDLYLDFINLFLFILRLLLELNRRD